MGSMATNVNVTLSNFRTGTNVSFQRRLVDVSVSYIDVFGESQTKTGTITFPDILQSLSAEDLKELALDVMLRAYRKTQGVD
jgi:hypothetical protein